MNNAMRCLYYQYFKWGNIKGVVHKPNDGWYYETNNYKGIRAEECKDFFKEITVIYDEPSD